MGCCPSVEDVVSIPKDVKLIELSNKEMSMGSLGDINLKIIIPDRESVASDGKVIETALPSPHSPSPTSVNQRSRKSVTFNPISTVKEYPRDSSCNDKNYITYLCSQLGEDTLSDDESDGLSPDEDQECEGEREWGQHTRVWAEEMYLEEQVEVDPTHPDYIEGYDFEYTDHTSQPYTQHSNTQHTHHTHTHIQHAHHTHVYKQPQKHHKKKGSIPAPHHKAPHLEVEDSDDHYYVGSYRPKSPTTSVWVC